MRLRPVEASPVGVWTVTVADKTRKDRRFWRELRRAMVAAGVEQGLLVPLFRGESIEAMGAETAASMAAALLECVGIANPVREYLTAAVAAVDDLPVGLGAQLDDASRKAVNRVIEAVSKLRGDDVAARASSAIRRALAAERAVAQLVAAVKNLTDGGQPALDALRLLAGVKS